MAIKLTFEYNLVGNRPASRVELFTEGPAAAGGYVHDALAGNHNTESPPDRITIERDVSIPLHKREER